MESLYQYCYVTSNILYVLHQCTTSTYIYIVCIRPGVYPAVAKLCSICVYFVKLEKIVISSSSASRVFIPKYVRRRTRYGTRDIRGIFIMLLCHLPRCKMTCKCFANYNTATERQWFGARLIRNAEINQRRSSAVTNVIVRYSTYIRTVLYS